MEIALSYLNDPQWAALVTLQRKEEDEANRRLAADAGRAKWDAAPSSAAHLEGAAVVQQADGLARRVLRANGIRMAHLASERASGDGAGSGKAGAAPQGGKRRRAGSDSGADAMDEEGNVAMPLPLALDTA